MASKPTQRCTRCGVDIPVSPEIRTRIDELENDVRMLTGRASTATDKLAKAEQELSKLKEAAHLHPHSAAPTVSRKPVPGQAESIPQQQPPPPPPPPPPTVQSVPSTPDTALPPSSNLKRSNTTGRFNLFGRKQNPTPSPAPDTPKDETELLSILTREQNLRAEAERKLTQVNHELEELSANLFQQANDMVAQERVARAKLEEQTKTLQDRVRVLETRDTEKRKRLDRLESALGRIERVKAVLDMPPPKYVGCSLFMELARQLFNPAGHLQV